MAKRKLAQRKGAAKKAKIVEDKPKVEEEKHEDVEVAASQGEEIVKQEPKEQKKTGRKLSKRTKPVTEPEYFEDQRNLVIFCVLNSVQLQACIMEFRLIDVFLNSSMTFTFCFLGFCLAEFDLHCEFLFSEKN